MQALKNVLIGIGILAIVLFLVLLVMGVKVVSTIVLYVVGGIAVIALIGLVIYYIGKFSGSDRNKV